MSDSQVTARTDSRPETAVCHYCKATFPVLRRRHARYAAKYCSVQCAAKQRGLDMQTTDVAAHLLARGRVEGDCFIWTGSTNNKGYGTATVAGSDSQIVTRIFWEAVRGPIPPGMRVCHTCDNPPCFKLDHLFLGTAKDNSEDMARKGRAANTRGEKSGKAKVTNEQVREMHRLRSEGRPLAEIGRTFGLHGAHVSRLTTGKRWAHLGLAPLKKETASGMPGVTRAGRKWRAFIDGKHIGCFATPEEAAAARAMGMLKRSYE